MEYIKEPDRMKKHKTERERERMRELGWAQAALTARHSGLLNFYNQLRRIEVWGRDEGNFRDFGVANVGKSCISQ